MPNWSALGDGIKHAWNAFRGRDHPVFNEYGMGSSFRPDRKRLLFANERSIITAIYNRIALDASAVNLYHVYLDENDRFKSEVDSGLNQILTLSANIDQTGRSFIFDIVMSMLDEGVVAVVPIDTNIDPTKSDSYDIRTMRTAKILQWFPEHVQINVYNDKTGLKEDVVVPKNIVSIIENPFYSVMNEPNSTAQRLIHKLALLDAIDEQSASGKLDLIIQLPYVIKTENRKKQAEERRKLIEEQLSGTKYGIAYTDGTEKITQLNRAVENNLLSQIEYLTNMLYGQLGITPDIMNGTANDQTMLNYYNRTIEPILSSIVEEFKRKFLTQNARTRGQSIIFIRDPFKLVPVNNLSEIVDKFTRNEVLSSNEVRSIIGYKPSNDPKADELRNKNINQSSEELNGAQDISSLGMVNEEIEGPSFDDLGIEDINVDEIIGEDELEKEFDELEKELMR